MQISEDELTLEYLEEKQEGSLLYVRKFVSDNTVVSLFTCTLAVNDPLWPIAQLKYVSIKVDSHLGLRVH